VPQTHDPKQGDPHGMQRADESLTLAYERIKSASEELARLDRLVSGLERGGDRPSVRQEGAGAARSDAAVNAAPTPENPARHPRLKGSQLMLRGVIGLVLATCIFAAAFASQYGHEAKAIMARWSPQVSIAPREAASEPRREARSPFVQIADADEQPAPPAPPSHKEAEDVPSGGPTMSADPAQSLKSIARDLAGIQEKLEQLKTSHEQTRRDHAEAIQQLKAAQEQAARNNARTAQQAQALQTQLAVLSAKSSGRSVMRETYAAVRHRPPAAAPRRPPRPRAPWMDAPGPVEPWFDPDW
jgi:hypothetical protein